MKNKIDFLDVYEGLTTGFEYFVAVKSGHEWNLKQKHLEAFVVS